MVLSHHDTSAGRRDFLALPAKARTRVPDLHRSWTWCFYLTGPETSYLIPEAMVCCSHCHVRDHVNIWHVCPLSLPRGAQGLTLVIFTKAQKQKPCLPSLSDLYKPQRFDTPEISQAEMPKLCTWAIKSSYKAKERQSQQVGRLFQSRAILDEMQVRSSCSNTGFLGKSR